LRALVKYDYGPGKMEIRDVEEPSPGADDALVRVEAAGVCGTDLHIEDGVWPVNPPVIAGHEFGGTIIQLGNNVKGWHIGDRVVSMPGFCGSCEHCLSGDYNLCDRRKPFGQAVDGVFAKLAAIPSRLLLKLPDNLTFEEGALIEPFANVVHAMLGVSHVKPGDTVVVVGPGPIGLLAAQVSKACGARTLVAGLSKDSARLNLAKKLGATTIDVERQDPVQEIMSLTSGKGADLALEACGTPPGVTLAVNAVRKRGQVTLMGVHSREVQLDPNQIMRRETILKGSFANTRWDWDRALRIASHGVVDLKPFISGTFKLDEWQKAFDLSREGRAIKALIVP